ncbi:MAG: hypothetical protein ACWIPJ_11095, partial [Polaribacter sp.]
LLFFYNADIHIDDYKIIIRRGTSNKTIVLCLQARKNMSIIDKLKAIQCLAMSFFVLKLENFFF